VNSLGILSGSGFKRYYNSASSALLRHIIVFLAVSDFWPVAVLELLAAATGTWIMDRDTSFSNNEINFGII